LALAVLIGLPLLSYAGGINGTARNSSADSLTDALLAAVLAAIIWTGAGTSLRMARLRERLPGLGPVPSPAGGAVTADTPLSEALRRANEAGAARWSSSTGRAAPRAGRESAIATIPEHRRPWVAVSGLAQDLTPGMRVSAELSGEELLDTLRATPASEYLVIEPTGEIYGVLSTADVERAFMAAMSRDAAV